MKIFQTALLMWGTATLLFATDAAQLAEESCGSCHIVSHPTIEKVKHLAAPPMWGIARRLKRELPSKEAFVDFVVDYALHPAKSKIRINKEAMERFGLMPSLEGSVDKKSLRQIAEWLYTTY